MSDRRRSAQTVLCTASHDVTLDDGRTLRPGDQADDIDTSSDHNAALVEDGHLSVVNDKRESAEDRTAREKREAEAAANAAKTGGGN
jgi:hypothetical protein